MRTRLALSAALLAGAVVAACCVWPQQKRPAVAPSTWKKSPDRIDVVEPQKCEKSPLTLEKALTLTLLKDQARVFRIASGKAVAGKALENGVVMPDRHGRPTASVKVTPFVVADGRRGFMIEIPGGRPLATPAYEGGRIFVGGGFGSYDFYAFDARTGKPIWHCFTKDDGPTAAVVSDGVVVFNTESCTLLAVSAETGRVLWAHWLGDPLMSQPAVKDGRVYMVYPDMKTHKHMLACFDLKKGNCLWRAPISGEAITAPILADGFVHLATVDGMLYKFCASSGEQIYAKREGVTSAPWVCADRVFVSRRKVVAAGGRKSVLEGVQTYDSYAGGRVGALANPLKARYLDAATVARSKVQEAMEKADSAVGFGTAPASAKLKHAAANIGQSTVAGCWAYQGARPCVLGSYCFCNHGNVVQMMETKTAKVLWARELKLPGLENAGWIGSTPPAVVNNKLFFGTVTGHVVCLDARTGKLLWSVKLEGERVRFQPAVARGWIYVPTDSGRIYAFPTGDEKDDGWYAWGGSATHNGPQGD